MTKTFFWQNFIFCQNKCLQTFLWDQTHWTIIIILYNYYFDFIWMSFDELWYYSSWDDMRKNLVSKQFWSTFFFCQRKVWSQRNVGKNLFWQNIKFCQNKVLVNNFLAEKKGWVNKSFGRKKKILKFFVGQKKMWVEIYLAEKKCGSKFFLAWII